MLIAALRILLPCETRRVPSLDAALAFHARLNRRAKILSPLERVGERAPIEAKAGAPADRPVGAPAVQMPYPEEWQGSRPAGGARVGDLAREGRGGAFVVGGVQDAATRGRSVLPGARADETRAPGKPVELAKLERDRGDAARHLRMVLKLESQVRRRHGKKSREAEDLRPAVESAQRVYLATSVAVHKAKGLPV